MKFASAGAWIAAGIALALAGCSDKAPAEGAAARPAVETAPAELREIDITASAEAVVEAVRQSTVAAQIAGRIVDVRFDVGDTVKKGEVIVRIDERAATQAVAASEAQVREAEAALTNARAHFERTRELFAQNFVSRAALDKAQSEFKSAESRMKGMLAGAGAAATERSFATVTAPYGGVVSARHVQVGEMASPGKPLMTGFDPSGLRVLATVPQTLVPAIRAGSGARVEIPSLGRWVTGTTVTVLPSADPRTHTTQVRIDLPEDLRGVHPGVFARAHFVTGKEPRLLVPRSAVLHRSEVTAVYVVDGDKVQLRQVRLGAAGDERSVEVLAGLKPGERVALAPARAGMATAPAR